MDKKVIYLDYNATTPIDPAVAEAMLPYLYGNFGNPSSSHSFGWTAKQAVEKARQHVAEMLGCLAEEVIFTSGGTESNNLAIKGVALARRKSGNHIITSAVEHPAVLEVCAYLETQGYRVMYLSVDEFGRVDPSNVEYSICPETILITVMHANNEVGTIQPITEIAAIAHSHNIPLHTDAAQSIGKIPVKVKELGVDLLTLAGHKVYAPKGTGALFVRTGTELHKLMHGAEHEHNLRAGTENVLAIVGLGQACALISSHLDQYSWHMQRMRDQLEKELTSLYPWIRINGHPDLRLPNTASISFRRLEANTILAELQDVAVSAGAACHADKVDVSHVLEAMHVPNEYAMGTIRFSVGRTTTENEISTSVQAIRQVVDRLNPEKERESGFESSEKIQLTHYTHGLGCACKMRPQLLEKVLKSIPVTHDSRIVVGTESADDAAVYRMADGSLIVQTVDFFTPIVDDPYQFGAISAANSLSDIYAMGAKPLFALSVVGFPSNRLPVSVLEEILNGAYDKVSEADIAVIGGHTIEDTEPKFGLAVTGEVQEDQLVTNKGAKAGDWLLLTKPIGTGILTTALKKGLLEDQAEKEVVSSMSILNRIASENMVQIGVNACTDVTGFGLLGHLLGMMKASNTTAEVFVNRIPLFSQVCSLAAAGIIPGGTKNNMEFTFNETYYHEEISQVNKILINDAQTSGGLLISIPKKRAEAFLGLMDHSDQKAWIIGRVISKVEKAIRVILE